MPDELLTYATVAGELGCTVRHVRALVKAGRLTAARFGLGEVRPRKRVKRSELERFVAAGEQPAPVPAERVKGRRLPPVPTFV